MGFTLAVQVSLCEAFIMSDGTRPKDVTAVILAGGKSSRMNGVDKTVFEIGGRPLIMRVMDVVTPMFGEVLVAGGGPGRFEDLEGVRVVQDSVEGVGPLAGIRAGFEAARTEWIFVVAADMPLIDRRLVAAVIDGVGPDVSAVVPCLDDKYEPLHAAYRRDLVPRIDRLIAGTVRKVTRLLDEVSVRWIPIDSGDHKYFKNINRPEDVSAVKKLLC